MFATLAETTGSGAGATIVSGLSDLAPQLTIVAAGAIAVGAVVLVFRRGWGLAKGLSK